MTPEIHYGFGHTVFGSTFLAHSQGRIYRLSFVPRNAEDSELRTISRTFPRHSLIKVPREEVQLKLDRWFPRTFSANRPPLDDWALQGTEFQRKVWNALLAVPPGETTTYAAIAKVIGHPRAFRAVGSAVGSNPIGYLIPCHRVLPQSGGLGQFAWGTELKRKMLQFENSKALSAKVGSIFKSP